jgi:hypothetical protein
VAVTRATDGGPLGIDCETLDALAAPGSPPTQGRRDVVLGTDTSYSLGYWKPFEGFVFGGDAAFGAPGAGGSFAFADPRESWGSPTHQIEWEYTSGTTHENSDSAGPSNRAWRSDDAHRAEYCN